MVLKMSLKLFEALGEETKVHRCPMLVGIWVSIAAVPRSSDVVHAFLDRSLARGGFRRLIIALTVSFTHISDSQRS